MPNFFEDQRNRLGISQRKLAMHLGVSNTAVQSWERDESVPNSPIAKLAEVYEVSENKMEREVMALRRRIEAKREAASPAK